MRAEQRESGRADPPPPFFGNQNSLRPLPKMRRIFHSGEALRETGFDGVILYSCCNFSRARRAIHCFDLVYPQEEKRFWDAVVTRINLSLRPLEG